MHGTSSSRREREEKEETEEGERREEGRRKEGRGRKEEGGRKGGGREEKGEGGGMKEEGDGSAGMRGVSCYHLLACSKCYCLGNILDVTQERLDKCTRTRKKDSARKRP